MTITQQPLYPIYVPASLDYFVPIPPGMHPKNRRLEAPLAMPDKYVMVHSWFLKMDLSIDLIDASNGPELLQLGVLGLDDTLGKVAISALLLKITVGDQEPFFVEYVLPVAQKFEPTEGDKDLRTVHFESGMVDEEGKKTGSYEVTGNLDDGINTISVSASFTPVADLGATVEILGYLLEGIRLTTAQAKAIEANPDKLRSMGVDNIPRKDEKKREVSEAPVMPMSPTMMPGMPGMFNPDAGLTTFCLTPNEGGLVFLVRAGTAIHARRLAAEHCNLPDTPEALKAIPWVNVELVTATPIPQDGPARVLGHLDATPPPGPVSS